MAEVASLWRARARVAAPSLLLPATVAVTIVAVLVAGGLHAAEVALAGLAAVAVVLVVMRRPLGSLGALLVFVPLQLALLSLLFRLGVPHGAARDLGYLNDLIVVRILG